MNRTKKNEIVPWMACYLFSAFASTNYHLSYTSCSFCLCSILRSVFWISFADIIAKYNSVCVCNEIQGGIICVHAVVVVVSVLIYRILYMYVWLIKSFCIRIFTWLHFYMYLQMSIHVRRINRQRNNIPAGLHTGESAARSVWSAFVQKQQ